MARASQAEPALNGNTMGYGMTTLRRGVFGAACFGLGVVASIAVGQTGYPPLQMLVSASESALGQKLEYPAGTPQITAAIVTLEPGASTGWHHHDVPLFAMILDGELTLDDKTGTNRRYVKDESFIEAFRSSHNGTNTGDTPVRILAVFAGSDAQKNTLMDE